MDLSLKKLRKILIKAAWVLLAAFAGIVLVSVLPVAGLRWIDPPTSAFMVRKSFQAWVQGRKDYRVHYEWVDGDRISPYAGIAVVAAEDQKFPEHWGFDFDSIRQALNDNPKRNRPRGASTITQQVAKNLFLWPGRSLVRKGLEAYLTLLIEGLWPKRRILEVYLNIAQFGPGFFGIQSASQWYFASNRQVDIPYGTFAVYAAVATVAGLLAASFPARRAARLNVLDAIAAT